MNIKKHSPNMVSASRPLCGLCALLCAANRQYRLALSWFLLGAATDNADGWLARRYDAATPIGKEVLEPVGDISLVKLAEFGLILGHKFTWKQFWAVSALGGILVIPLKLLPGEHRLALRCDTAIGVVYVGEMVFCFWRYTDLAQAKKVRPWAVLSLPIIGWLCRHTIRRWMQQLC